MTPSELIHLLLDSSFRTAERFYVRHTAFSVIQAILFGFVVHTIGSGIVESGRIMIIVVSIFGIVFSVLHLQIQRVSEYYNRSWFTSLLEFVGEEVSRSKPGKRKTITLTHLARSLEPHAYATKLPHWPHWHATTIFKIIPIIFMALWITVIIGVFLRWFGTQPLDGG